MDGVTSFTCLCRPGYTGAHCQHEADPCLSRPCLHGGICTAAHPGFRCACPEGFTGAQCQVGEVTTVLGEEFRGMFGGGGGGGCWIPWLRSLPRSWGEVRRRWIMVRGLPRILGEEFGEVF